jgi:Ca-activated chloride channel homolog
MSRNLLVEARRMAFALLCTVLAAACAHGGERTPTTVRLDDPGPCEPVDVVAAPEVAPVLDRLSKSFNESPESRPPAGACVFVRVHSVDPAQAMQHLAAGWKDAPPQFGPRPALWVPASSAWVALTNEKRKARGGKAVVGDGPSFGNTPPVIAMPKPMATALGWPAQQPTWADLAALAANPRGWAAYGHPEWGDFRLGKADPTLSTPALLQTIAVDKLDPAAARALESDVVSYGDTTWPFLDTLYRLDQKAATPFVSAVAADERAVVAYNRGSTNGLVPAENADLTPPKTPLVAIPAGAGTFDSDYPLAPITGSWVSDTARAGAEAFTKYVRQPKARRQASETGLHTSARIQRPTEPVTPALQRWETIRKRARVMLLFDVSESMGDPSDPKVEDSPSKIALAKKALLTSLSGFRPDDQVGLRIFTTKLAGGPSDRWKDIVPIGPFADKKAALKKAINGLSPQQGSPLYAATRDAYDAMDEKYDSSRINGVVMITDGHNEDDEHDDRAALLNHLREPIRMVTISYSSDADMSTMRRIAQATNTRVYDATDTRLIDALYPAAVSNF